MFKRLRELGIYDDAKAGLIKCVPCKVGAFKLQVRNIKTGVIYDL